MRAPPFRGPGGTTSPTLRHPSVPRLAAVLALPRSARLATWTTAWLAGVAALDEAVGRIVGDDEPHRVAGVPGNAGEAGLATALGQLRACGATSVRLALPSHGDPLGLVGPPELTGAAVLAGEAAVAVGTAAVLVPSVVDFGPPGDVGHLVTWQWHAAGAPGQVPDAAEAERELAEHLLDAAGQLGRLDVAAWRPEIGQLLEDVRHGPPAAPLPRPYPPRAQALAARAARLRAVVALALGDDGGALSASAVFARREALRPLERATRRALVAACSLP